MTITRIVILTISFITVMINIGHCWQEQVTVTLSIFLLNETDEGSDCHLVSDKVHCMETN
jgi:hypothetical protein